MSNKFLNIIFCQTFECQLVYLSNVGTKIWTSIICTVYKSSTSCRSVSVCVDGVEWSGVKFFQLSSQWQTHIKQFPIAVFINHDPLWELAKYLSAKFSTAFTKACHNGRRILRQHDSRSGVTLNPGTDAWDVKLAILSLTHNASNVLLRLYICYIFYLFNEVVLLTFKSLK